LPRRRWRLVQFVCGRVKVQIADYRDRQDGMPILLDVYDLEDGVAKVGLSVENAYDLMRALQVMIDEIES
tara:strand:- start:7802 stop:8011 length:210 start_codon:yes stop_codon:yes gene_type:complete